jgi:hypothetical protein
VTRTRRRRQSGRIPQAIVQPTRKWPSFRIVIHKLRKGQPEGREQCAFPGVRLSHFHETSTRKLPLFAFSAGFSGWLCLFRPKCY